MAAAWRARGDGGRLYGLTALLFFGTCLAYLDRQVIALLKPSLQAHFGWSDVQFAHMGSAFSLTTAFTVLVSGWIVDRVGVRRSYAWAMGVWSMIGIGHAFATTAPQFVAARVLLALGESVNGPAAVKATAVYLPVEQRSVALGLITASTSIGAIVAPLAIPPIALVFGWQAAFVVTGAFGFVWLALWLRGTSRLDVPAAGEARGARAPFAWRAVFMSRYTWAIIGARLVADWVFWVVLFWAPDLFTRLFHLSQAELGPPIALTYAMAALGALASGVTFPLLVRRGTRTATARQLSLFGFALLALPLPLVLHVGGAWPAAFIIGATMLAHNAFSTNLFGIIADNVAVERVGTVMALGSIASNVSGFLMIEFAGWCLAQGYGYRPVLMAAAVAYLVAGLLVRIVLHRPAPEGRGAVAPGRP